MMDALKSKASDAQARLLHHVSAPAPPRAALVNPITVVLYCTVLYCTVLYCTVLCSTEPGAQATASMAMKGAKLAKDLGIKPSQVAKVAKVAAKAK